MFFSILKDRLKQRKLFTNRVKKFYYLLQAKQADDFFYEHSQTLEMVHHEKSTTKNNKELQQGSKYYEVYQVIKVLLNKFNLIIKS